MSKSYDYCRSVETSVNYSQTNLQAGNSTGAMIMLDNAEQILSTLRGNMTIMVKGDDDVIK